jgi:hypothetical protein
MREEMSVERVRKGSLRCVPLVDQLSLVLFLDESAQFLARARIFELLDRRWDEFCSYNKHHTSARTSTALVWKGKRRERRGETNLLKLRLSPWREC